MSKTLPISKFTSKVGSGATPRGGKEAYLGGDYALIRSQNVQDFVFSYDGLAYIDEKQAKALDNVKIQQGDVLLNITGDSIARCCTVPKDISKARVNQHVSIIRCNNINDSEYLKYYLIYIKPYLMQICGVGGTRNALTKEAINKLPVTFQDNYIELAKILSTLDAKIELNNKINKELEAMAKTLYDYWFVQFDFPNENNKPYKSSGGKMVYSHELKREIPEGWEVKPISELTGINKGGDWGKENIEGNYIQKVSCIRGADLNGLNGLGELNPPERFILEKNSNKILESNDLIVEISGGSPTQSTGRLAFIIGETLNRFDNPIICSNFCKSFSLKDSKQLYFFVYTWNMLYDNGVLFGWEGKTSGIKNLLFDSFTQKYHIVVPSEKANVAFYEKAKVIHKLKQKHLQQNQELAKLRDWLLPMLMNGQVKVA
jgi:type I restriction enzyme S subunit